MQEIKLFHPLDLFDLEKGQKSKGLTGDKSLKRSSLAAIFNVSISPPSPLLCNSSMEKNSFS